MRFLAFIVFLVSGAFFGWTTLGLTKLEVIVRGDLDPSTGEASRIRKQRFYTDTDAGQQVKRISSVFIPTACLIGSLAVGPRKRRTRRTENVQFFAICCVLGGSWVLAGFLISGIDPQPSMERSQKIAAASNGNKIDGNVIKAAAKEGTEDLLENILLALSTVAGLVSVLSVTTSSMAQSKSE